MLIIVSWGECEVIKCEINQASFTKSHDYTGAELVEHAGTQCGFLGLAAEPPTSEFRVPRHHRVRR